MHTIHEEEIGATQTGNIPFPSVEVTAVVMATGSAHVNTGRHMPFNGNALFHLGTNTLSEGHTRGCAHVGAKVGRVSRLPSISKLYINISLAVPQELNSGNK